MILRRYLLLAVLLPVLLGALCGVAAYTIGDQPLFDQEEE